HQAGDAIERFVPGQARPLVGAGLAHHRVLQAVGALDEVQQSGALGAQAAAVDRMIRVALDVDDLLIDGLAAAAAAVEDQSAAYRAVGAGVAGCRGVGQLEMPYRLGEGSLGRHAQGRHAGRSKADTADLEELATVHVHRFFPYQAKTGRPLKNVGEAGKTRQKQPKKRSLVLLNEHYSLRSPFGPR